VHHLVASGLGWIADAPLVPLAYRLFRLIEVRSTMSSAGASGCQGARTVDRAERHRAPNSERTGSRVHTDMRVEAAMDALWGSTIR
jgi:hypothetical protein